MLPFSTLSLSPSHITFPNFPFFVLFFRVASRPDWRIFRLEQSEKTVRSLTPNRIFSFILTAPLQGLDHQQNVIAGGLALSGVNPEAKIPSSFPDLPVDQRRFSLFALLPCDLSRALPLFISFNVCSCFDAGTGTKKTGAFSGLDNLNTL